MLHIYRRHGKVCKKENPNRGRSYWRCDCPIWVQESLGGESVSQALDVTSREAASRLVNEWNAAGKIGVVKEEPPRVDDAVTKYLEAKRNKKLADSTLYKLRHIFESQFLGFCKREGVRYLREVTPATLLEWQSTWKDAPLAASKKYQRVVGFFYFCIRMKLMTDNPMKSIDPPKVKQVPTLPFKPEEVNAIVSACDRYPVRGIYGEGNRRRLRAMVLLLRYSGLRIRDAATLRRERLQDGKLLLYMQKTAYRSSFRCPHSCGKHSSTFRTFTLLSSSGPATVPENHGRGLAAVTPQPLRSRGGDGSASPPIPRHLRRRAPSRRRAARSGLHPARPLVGEDHGEELCAAVGQGAAGAT